jgi:uncharacterized protein YkwD
VGRTALKVSADEVDDTGMTLLTPTTTPTSRRRTTRRVAWLTALIAVVALGLGACTPDSNRATDLVNQSRNANGLPGLQVNIDLYLQAAAWSNQLANDQYLHHRTDLSEGIGYAWRVLGENVGRGYSLDQVQTAFMNSPAHRANILDPRFDTVGVGVTRDANGQYWIVQEFMQQR